MEKENQGNLLTYVKGVKAVQCVCVPIL